MRIALEMRLTGGSDVYLAPQRGHDAYASIEFVTEESWIAEIESLRTALIERNGVFTRLPADVKEAWDRVSHPSHRSRSRFIQSWRRLCTPIRFGRSERFHKHNTTRHVCHDCVPSLAFARRQQRLYRQRSGTFDEYERFLYAPDFIAHRQQFSGNFPASFG